MNKNKTTIFIKHGITIALIFILLAFLLVCCFSIFANKHTAHLQNNSISSTVLSVEEKGKFASPSNANIGSGTDFVNAFYGASTPSGVFNLTTNITVNITSISDVSRLTRKISNLTFNGQGYTITITGSKTFAYSVVRAPMNEGLKMYAGLLFGGEAANVNVSNLKVVYNAQATFTYTATASGGIPGSEDHHHFPASPYHIYAGIFTGNGSGLTLENMTITTSSSSYIYARGIDAMSGFSDTKKPGGTGKQAYKKAIDRSVGASSGVIAGTSTGSTTIDDVTMEHNGLVQALAHNRIAGQGYPNGGNSGNYGYYTPDDTSSKSTSAIFIGLLSTSGVLNVNFLHLKGNGATYSTLTAYSGFVPQYFNKDYSSTMIGKTENTARNAVKIKGMIFDYLGYVIVSTRSENNHVTRKSNLLFSGDTNVYSNESVNVENLFRDKKINSSHVGYTNAYSTYTSAASAINATSGKKVSAQNKDICNASEEKLGFLVSIRTVNCMESLPTFYYGTTVLSEFSGQFLEFEKIGSSSVRNLKFKAKVTAAHKFLSAIYYNKGTQSYFDTIYEQKVTEHTFSTPIDTSFIGIGGVYTYEIVGYNASSLSCNIASGYTKTYNSSGILFEANMFGAAQGYLPWANKIVWEAKYELIDQQSGFDILEPQYSNGTGSGVVNIPATAGKYLLTLKKQDSSGAYKDLVVGDVIGSNSATNPSTVYTYPSSNGALKNRLITITPKDASIIPGSLALAREYNGDVNLDMALVPDSHYEIIGLVAGESTPKMNFVNASFDSKNIGDNKGITIEGITFDTPNYTSLTTDMSLNNGRITAKNLGYKYVPSSGYVNMGGTLHYKYIGENIVPKLEVDGAVSEEVVDFDIKIYGSNSASDQNQIEAKHVNTTSKPYYYFRLSLKGSDQGNYQLIPLYSAFGVPFKIVPLEISLSWRVNGISILSPEYESPIFNNYNQSSLVTVSSLDIISGEEDNISWDIMFSHKTSPDTVFRNAGVYVTTASIIFEENNERHDNYVINETSQVGVEIEIKKYTFKIDFIDALGEAVEEFEYENGSDLKLKVHVRQSVLDNVVVPSTEIDKVSFEIYKIEQGLIPQNNIINVGEYLLRAVYSETSSNFSLNSDDNETEITVKPTIKKISALTTEFIYRASDIRNLVALSPSNHNDPQEGMVYFTLEFQRDGIKVPEVKNIGIYTAHLLTSSSNYKPIYEDNENGSDTFFTIEVKKMDISMQYSDPSIPLLLIEQLPPYQYTGSPIEPRPVVKLVKTTPPISEHTLERNVDYLVSYEDNEEVGEATITITGINNYEKSKTLNFQITRITLGVNFIADKSFDYDSKNLSGNINYSLTGNILGSEAKTRIDFSYMKKGNTSYVSIQSDKVIYCGDYKATLVLTDDPINDNYSLPNNPDDIEFSFKITEKDLEVEFYYDSNLRYDNDVKDIQCYINEEFLGINDKGENGEASTTVAIEVSFYKSGAPINATQVKYRGSYTVKATLNNSYAENNFNYKLVGITSNDFIINPKVVEFTFEDYTDLVYDAQSKVIGVNKIGFYAEDSATDELITRYSRKGTTGDYTTVSAPVDAGEYKMEVYFRRGTSNYEADPNTSILDFIIDKVSIVARFFYGGSLMDPSIIHEKTYNNQHFSIQAKLSIADVTNPYASQLNAYLEQYSLIPSYRMGEESVSEARIVGSYQAVIINIPTTLENYAFSDNYDPLINLQINPREMELSWGSSIFTDQYQAIARSINLGSITANELGEILSELIEIKAYKKTNALEEYYNISLEEIKDVAFYKIEVILISGNYYFKEDSMTVYELAEEFEITKKTITNYVPQVSVIEQSYGYYDGDYSFNYIVSYPSLNLEESIDVTLNREPGDDAGFYAFLGASTSNPNYDITLEFDPYKGVIINKYSYELTISKPFEKNYGESNPNFEQTYDINLPKKEIRVTVTYAVDINVENAGEHDLDASFSFVYENDNEGKLRQNINLILSEQNRQKKFIIYPKEVNISGRDINIYYGDKINEQFLYQHVEFSDPEGDLGDGHANANDGFETKQNYFSLKLYKDEDGNVQVNMQDLFRGIEDANTSGFWIEVVMNDSNYIRKYHVRENTEDSFVPKLYIHKITLEKYGINLSSYSHKVYDGHAKISFDANHSPWLNHSEVNEVAFASGLSISARFSDQNVGENKAIFVQYTMPSLYEKNFTFPDEFQLEELGMITPKSVILSFAKSAYEMTYGGDILVSLNKIQLAGNDTLENIGASYNLICELDAENNIPLNEVREVGEYIIKIQFDKGEDDIKNYEFNYDATANLYIRRKDIELIIVENAIYEKWNDGTTSCEISADLYSLDIGDDDKNEIQLFYTESLINASPSFPNNKVELRNIRISSSTGVHLNYNLLTTRVEIKAEVKNIIKDFSLKSLNEEGNYIFTYDGRDKKAIISYNVTDSAPDIDFIITYGDSSTLPKNSGEYKIMIKVVRPFVVNGKIEMYSETMNINSFLIIKKLTPEFEVIGNTKQIYGDFKPLSAKVYSFVELDRLDENINPENIRYEFTGNQPSAGTYKVQFEYAGAANYEAKIWEKELIISKKEVELKFSGYKELVYNANDQSNAIIVDVEGLVEPDILSIQKIFSLTDSQETKEVINAGSYNLRITSDDTNYMLKGVTSLNFEIKKANLRVTVEKIEDTGYSKKPEYIIKYEGFWGEDGEDLFIQVPDLNIGMSQIGENFAFISGGKALNYNFEYDEKIPYVVTPEADSSQTKISAQDMPYIILGVMAGFIVLILLFSFLGKTLVLKNAAKRKR